MIYSRYRKKANGLAPVTPPSPSNRKRSGHPIICTAAEKERLREFVTRDKTTRRMAWEDIREAMGYNCSAKSVKRAMQSLGYNKRYPRRK